MLRRYTKEKNPSGGLNTGRTRLYAITLVVIMLVLSGLYLHFAWHRYEKNATAEAIMLAQSIKAMFHPEQVEMLSGGSEDLQKPEYIMAKQALIRLVETTNPIRFAYLLGQQDGSIIFLVDSESADSADYSPPGQIYEEAKDIDWVPFRIGRIVLTSPATDRWGTWVSALVPIKDPVDHDTIAVFGIDYSASKWYLNLWKRMIPDVIVIISIMILFFDLLHTRLIHSDLKERSKKLAFDEALYHSVFDQASIGIAIVNDKKFISQSKYSNMNMNPMFERILGRTSHDLDNTKWPEITHPDDLQADEEKFDRFQKGEIDGYSMEKRFIRPDGTSVWTYMKISRFTGSSDGESVHLCLLEDISWRKEIENALKESERSKTVLLSHLPGMAYRCRHDRNWTMEFVSEGCRALTGHPPESLLQNRDLSYRDLIAPVYRETLSNEWNRVLDRRMNFRQEYEILTKTGEQKWVLEMGQGIFDGAGNVEALEGIVVDITEQRTRQAEIAYLRERDFLTGLYNRNYFEAVKSRLDQPAYWPLSIAVWDINSVRLINDIYGHAEGDRLIADVARLIKGCCRKGDILARTGGDDFSLLMPHTTSDAARQTVIQINNVVESYNRARTPNRYDISMCVGYSTKESGEQAMDDVEKTAESHLNHRKLLNQKSSHNAILSSIMATLYAKSQETEEHGQRMTQLTVMIGKSLGLAQKELDDLELLSMLHDIGKIGVNDSILNKPGRLTPDEWIQMKKHSEIGHRIAMSTPELEHIAEFILHHHERWDGTGYPAGLKGKDIPLPSRILAVADAYDAITQKRVYRNASPWEFAVEEIKRCSGSQFDPEVASLFVDLIREQNGSSAKPQGGEGGME